LEMIGRAGTPLEFLICSFVTVPCAIAAGSLGLLAFGARFPERVPSLAYRRIERSVQIAVACTVVAFAQWYFGQMFGSPTFDRAQLVDTINYPSERSLPSRTYGWSRSGCHMSMASSSACSRQSLHFQ
jgi:hypothetical protein